MLYFGGEPCRDAVIEDGGAGGRGGGESGGKGALIKETPAIEAIDAAAWVLCQRLAPPHRLEQYNSSEDPPGAGGCCRGK